MWEDHWNALHEWNYMLTPVAHKFSLWSTLIAFFRIFVWYQDSVLWLQWAVQEALSVHHEPCVPL